MKTKKSMSKLILILTVAALAAAGCTSGNKNGTPTAAPSGSGGSMVGENAEKPLVKYKYLIRGITKPTSSTEDEIGQLIKEKFNVEFEFIPYNESNYEKAQVMLAANDWGDIDIVTTGLDDITKKYIQAGVFLKLDDYKDLLPNFFDYEKDVIPYWRTFDENNGDLYVWQAGPDQQQLTSEPLDIVTRVDVLEGLGWPQLDTTDDYIEFLRNAMKKFPESLGKKSIGMINFWGEPIGPLLATYLPRHSGYQHVYKTTGLVDVEAKKFVSLPGHPYTKETFKFWNTLYREGLMDKEAWTDKFPEFQKKWESGVALTANFAKWMVPDKNAKMEQLGHPEMQYIVTPIRLSIAKNEGKNVRYELTNSLRPDETTGILKTAKNPERLLEVINFMASKEMTIRLGWGVEGRDYVVKDGVRVPTEEYVQIVKSGDPDKVLQKRFGIGYATMFPIRYIAVGDDGQHNMASSDSRYLMAVATETQKKAYQAYGWDTMLDAWHNNPNFKLESFDITPYIVASNIAPSQSEAKIEEKIIQLMNKQIPLIITAKNDAEFENHYNETVSKADELGLQKIIDKYNEQLQNFSSRIEELSSR